MIRTLDDFYTGAQPYVALFDAFCKKHNLVGRAKPDHICYKTGSKESFEHIRSLFERDSHYIYQSIISNRRIAVIRFKQGIMTALGEITLLELSDQKPDNSQTERYDHIEAYPTTLSYDELVKELSESEKVILDERPHHTTHDIDIGNGFLFRCTHGSLIEKIKNLEMI